MDKFFFCRGKGQAPRTWNGLPRWDGRLPECLRLLWCFVLLCCPTAGAEVRTGSPSDSGFRVSQRSSEPVLIDLSKRETFVALSIQADPQDIEITQVEARNLPSSHHLNPRGGVIGYGEPVDIVLKEPAGVRIRLALVTRGDELALRISPQVVLGDGEAIELTQDRIERAARSLQRRIKDLHRRLAALAAARRRLQAWLNSPVNKPLDAVKAARAIERTRTGAAAATARVAGSREPVPGAAGSRQVRRRTPWSRRSAFQRADPPEPAQVAGRESE